MNGIEPGSIFILHGLQGQPAFNGHAVCVLEYNAEQGRFLVAPAENNSPLPPSLAIKPQNLQPMAQQQPMSLPQQGQGFLRPGMTCTLLGLNAQQYNGHMVTIVEFVPGEERYRVQPVDSYSPLPPVLSIKPSNLRPSLMEARAAMTPSSLPEHPRSESRRSLFSSFRRSRSRSRPTTTRGMGPRSDSMPSLVPAGMHRVASMPMMNQTPMPSIASGRHSVGAPRDHPMAPRTAAPAQTPGVPLNINVISDAFNESTKLAPGSRARLQGLNAKPELNGQVVKVLAFVAEHGRYRVQTSPTSAAMMVKPEALVPVPAATVTGLSSESTASTLSFRPGDKARLQGLKAQPALNGHLVEIKEYVAETDRYRVQPCGVEAAEECGGIMAIKTENLVSEEPVSEDAAPLETGTRAVLTEMTDKPFLNGEIVVVEEYLVTQRSYRVRLLGRKNQSLLLRPRQLRMAPTTAFWARMKTRGQRLRVPSSIQIDENQRLRVVMDAFAGIDRVIEVAKVVLGEDRCDWMNDGEVLETLRNKPSPPLTCQPPAGRAGRLCADEVLVHPHVKSKVSFFAAMVEYDLLKATGKTLDVGEKEVLEIYRVNFERVVEEDTNLWAEEETNPIKMLRVMDERSTTSTQVSDLSTSMREFSCHYHGRMGRQSSSCSVASLNSSSHRGEGRVRRQSSSRSVTSKNSSSDRPDPPDNNKAERRGRTANRGEEPKKKQKKKRPGSVRRRSRSHSVVRKQKVVYVLDE